MKIKGYAYCGEKQSSSCRGAGRKTCERSYNVGAKRKGNQQCFWDSKDTVQLGEASEVSQEKAYYNEIPGDELQ